MDEFRQSKNHADKEIAIGLYLMIHQAKPSILLEGGAYSAPDYVERKQRLIQFAKTHEFLYVVLPAGEHIERLLVYNPKLVSAQLIKQIQKDDLFLAEALDFGCMDPNYSDTTQNRYGYAYTAADQTGQEVQFQTYICTESKRVSKQFLEKKLLLYQETLKPLQLSVTYRESISYSEIYLYGQLQKVCETPNDVKEIITADVANNIANTYANLDFFRCAQIFRKLQYEKIVKHRFGLLALLAMCVYDRCEPCYPVSTETSDEMGKIAEVLEKVLLRDIAL